MDRRNIRNAFNFEAKADNANLCHVTLSHGESGDIKETILHLDGFMLGILAETCIDALEAMVKKATSPLDSVRERAARRSP